MYLYDILYNIKQKIAIEIYSFLFDILYGLSFTYNIRKFTIDKLKKRFSVKKENEVLL